MLRIYICPQCYNFRMVSRKPDAICFHCGSILERCDLEYIDYMNMTKEERGIFRQNYINRMQTYHNKVDALQKENE